MPTLRDLGIVPGAEAARPTLRDAGIVPGPPQDAAAGRFMDQAAANSMGQLRKGFSSGLYSADANALATDESVARAAGRTGDADALRLRIDALQGRAATFAPTEQDVTKLGWQPGRVADWALGAAGQGAASMLEPAGAAAGLGVASRVLGAVPTAPTRLLGGALRLAAPGAAGYLSYRQNKGEFYNDAVNDPALMAGRTPQEIDDAGTFHGAVAGALDTALPALAGERIAGRAGMKALAKAGVPAKVGLDLAGEGVTETLQGEVKRGTLSHLNPDRDTSGDASERWNDFAGGIAGAGPLSAASHLVGKGHARVGVADDPSSDVGGKGSKPAAPPARENLTQSLKRRAKAVDDADGAEAWQATLRGIGEGDLDTQTDAQHAGLLKELGARADKGDAVAKQHFDTLSAMDRADPAQWFDESPRMAAADYVVGDGTDHEKVLSAYKARKLNEQGGAAPTATAKLAASIMQDAVPETSPGLDKVKGLVQLKEVAADLAHQIADFASRPKPKFGDNAALHDTADTLVSLYGFEGAKAVLAKVATAAGVEKTPMFKQLQGSLSAADYRAFKQSQRKQRGEAAGELAAALPPEAHLALREKGVDLTTDSGRIALLGVMQDYANGKLDRKRVEMNALLGGSKVVDKLLDMVAPGKVEEKPETTEPKKSGGEKTPEPGMADDLSDPDDWELDGALKNVERSPGTKLYLFKGRQAVGSTEADHPFAPNKKTGNLPTLSGLDDKNKDGSNTLEAMQANAYLGLGGGEFGNERSRVVQTIAGPMRPGEARKTRATTTESAPMQDIASATPGTQGVGSHRIRTVSAREVMDHHGVKAGKRVELMRAYLARGDKPVLAESDPTIQQIGTFDRKINARINETPKQKIADGAVRDNPRYLELRDMQGQRREAMAKLAAKIGVDVSEDASVEDLANAYFAERFLVVAEQMAEKDGLRLDVAEVRKMMRRGNDDLDYSDQHKADGTQAEVQASMNLIRFPSKNAISKDGIGVIRAGDLVKWVFDNRTTFNKKDYSSDETHAHDFRDALAEGIGALAADGYMTSLPFMINAKGQVESFADGFPPSLRLSGLTQAEMDKRKAKRAEKRTEMVGPVHEDPVALDQVEPEADRNTDAEELLDQGRERKRVVTTEGVPEAGFVGPRDPLARTDIAASERYWDAPRAETADELARRTPGAKDKDGKPVRQSRYPAAPETVETRSAHEGRVPSELEPRKQASGVPTERTDIAQRTEVLGSATANIETLTMANAMRKAEQMADGLWSALGFQMKSQVVKGVLIEADSARDAKADPRAGRDRLERLVNALTPKDGLAGGKQYAAPLAHLLTPAHVERLVATAKNPTKAKADLELMRSKAADALTGMGDGGFSTAEKTALARLLTGNEKLTPSAAKAALEKMSWPARMERKAAMEAAAAKAVPMKAAPEPTAAKPSVSERVDARVLNEDYDLKLKQVRPFLDAAKARLAELEAMSAADQDMTPNQATVLYHLREMFAPNSDLASFYTEVEDFHLLSYAQQNRLIDALDDLTVGTKANAQAAAQAAPSEAKIAEARAYLAKVLGPKVVVEFSKDFANAGEWVEAANLVRLSTAIGPGVLSVAHHEAMHAFWSRAIKSHPGAAEALSKVMSSPAMLERLTALLHEHPAALAAITTGPHAAEERVAYAFQFWAAGELDVDKPATTLFAKFRKALRKVLGMVRDSEVALDLMTALHDGKLAEPSAAGQAIDKIMKAQTWSEDFKRKFDRQVQGVHAAISTANDVLRKEAMSPTAQRLGLAMFTNPGEQSDGRFKEGYINARNRKIRQYTNYLYAAIKGLSERDMVAAVGYLQNPDTKASDIPYAPVRKAVEAVRALTRRYYEYATTDAGLKLEYLGDNHFPRVWSLNALIEEGGKDKFVAMLMQPKYAKTMTTALDLANASVSSAATKATLTDIAEGMYRHLVDKNGVDEKGLDGEREANALLTPFFASQKERSFKWLDPEDVKPFLEKDLVGAMSRYLHQGIRAAEFARRFGEGGKDLKEMLAMKGDEWVNPDTDRKESRPAHGKIAAEIEDAIKAKGVKGKEAEQMLARHMEDIKNAVAAQEGSLGNDISPTFRKWSSAAMAYQNLRLLPMSLFAAFGDVMGLAARGAGGKATFEAFAQGLKDVYLRWKDAASDVPEARAKSVWEGIAEMIGAVDSHMFLEQMGKAHTSEFMTDFARRTNRALFMVNGLTAWDRSMRVSATKAAVLFLQDHAGLPDKQHSKRWLAELGLAASDIPLDAGGKLITDRHVLAATKGIPLEQATAQMERVHYALTRWVEGAVLTPNAGQRPSWASDPHYAVLFHLKQFTYSFHHTILKRAFNEASSGNMNPIGALAAAVPTMIAADMVKGVVVGGGSLPAYMKAWDAGDWIQHGAARAGLGGVGQFGIDALRDPLSVLGPTVDQAGKFILHPTEILGNIHDAIPGARMIKGLPDLARAVE